jgi:hypothetical protein
MRKQVAQMYVARFSYDLLPINRQQGVDFVRKEVETAIRDGLNARLLVPLTRGQSSSPALQFEVELTNLDQLDQFRSRGAGSAEDIKSWMHAFSKILTAPPCVEILRVDETKPS